MRVKRKYSSDKIVITQTDKGQFVGVLMQLNMPLYQVTDSYPTKNQVQQDIDSGFIDTSMYREFNRA